VQPLWTISLEVERGLFCHLAESLHIIPLRGERDQEINNINQSPQCLSQLQHPDISFDFFKIITCGLAIDLQIYTMKVKNVEVNITTATGPLTEYEDLDESDSEVRYIQVQEGCTWELCVRIHDIHQLGPEANAIVVYLDVDGMCVDGVAFPISQSQMVLRHASATTAGGGRIRRAFTFAKIIVTEDQDHIGQARRQLGELGEIKVVVRRYVQTGVIEKLGSENLIETIKHVHEKDLKGRDITHAIGFSDRASREARYLVCQGRLLDKHDPLATVRFRYRSERALKSLGLIPKTPSPPALSQIDSVSIPPDEDRSRDELIAELRRLRRERSSLPSVKQEPPVKRERRQSITATVPRAKKVKTTIDLTGDSD